MTFRASVLGIVVKDELLKLSPGTVTVTRPVQVVCRLLSRTNDVCTRFCRAQRRSRSNRPAAVADRGADVALSVGHRDLHPPRDDRDGAAGDAGPRRIDDQGNAAGPRSEEHTSELQSRFGISYAVF